MPASAAARASVFPAGGVLPSPGNPLDFGIEWDAENRLTAVKQGGNTLASFTYDGAGRRASKTAGGVTTTYVYAWMDIVEERPSSGGTIRYWYGPGIDDVLAKQDTTGAVSYYAKDHLGSVRQITNASGATTLTRDYDPWGNLLAGASTSGYAFTGREWDPEASLYYYRARYYDPKIGRFISEDPIGFEAGVNVYSYVNNNPVNFVDPEGLQACIIIGRVPFISRAPIRFPNQTFNEAARPVRPTAPKPFVPKPAPPPVIDPTPGQIVPRMPWWMRILYPWLNEVPVAPDPPPPPPPCNCA